MTPPPPPPPPPITANFNTMDETATTTLQQPPLAARQQQHRTPSPCPLATFATKTTAASSSPATGPVGVVGVVAPATHGQAPLSSHQKQSGGESPSPLAPPVKLTAAQKKAERQAAAAVAASGNAQPQVLAGRCQQQQPKHSLSHHHHHEWQPGTLMRWYRDNQIELPLALLTLLLAGAAIAPPSASSYFHNIVVPAYPLSADAVARHPPNSTSPGPATNLYSKGPWDVAFVAFGIIIWTLVRAVTIDHVLKPLARKLKCTRSHVERFGEQGWLGLYYSVSWSIGMWFVYRSPFWMNVEQFWIDYPHEYLSGEFKAYYLLQLAFWIQQVLVIHIEKPRKDYTQMLVHHFVTCALIISSYCTNFTRVGSAILATMDVGDIFLSTAKCLNYIRWRKTCDAMFVAFVGVWIYSRHYVYNVIVASIYRDIPRLLAMEYKPERGHYMSWPALYFFLALLGTLQVLLLIWLYMIFRVIIKVVRGSTVEDTRSDEESGAEDEDEEEGEETERAAEPKKLK